MRPPASPRRRRIGALVAILAASSAALRGTATHVSHTQAAPVWSDILTAASIVFLVFAIVFLVVMAVRNRR